MMGFSDTVKDYMLVGGSEHGRIVALPENQARISGFRVVVRQDNWSLHQAVPFEPAWDLPLQMTFIEYRYTHLYFDDGMGTRYVKAVLLAEGENFTEWTDSTLGDWVKSNPDQTIISSVYLSLGKQEKARSELEKLIPGMEEILPPGTVCPECYLKWSDKRVSSLMIHLNDQHWMPLEEIADFLETLPVDLTVKEGDKNDESI